jgi:hypothetical protein
MGVRSGSGMRHKYQVKDRLKHVYTLLKGRDATVYESLRALGYEPVLYLNYRRRDPDEPDTFLFDRYSVLTVTTSDARTCLS